jgi:hypothetical protein
VKASFVPAIIPYRLENLARWARQSCIALFAGMTVACGFASEDSAASNPAVMEDPWGLPGLLGGGIKGNDAYAEGSLFLTFPAFSTIGADGRLDGDVIFIEPYSSWGKQDEVAVSLGLGWRHLFTRQPISAVTSPNGQQAGFWEEGAFVGANLFADTLRTQLGNNFWQMGAGLEAGTRYIEARANYYLPLSDRQQADYRSTETIRTEEEGFLYAEPFAVGHTIQQDVTVQELDVTTTIERLFHGYEDGIEGWDSEVALLVPWVDRWMDVKLLAGYYSFDNQPFGPQVGGTGKLDGWKTGVEVRPVPAVAFSLLCYEDDRLTGSDWITGVRFEVPFEAGDLGDGKGLWGRIEDSLQPRRRHLAERMIEPVRRQNSAVKISASFKEDTEAMKVSSSSKVISESQRREILADSVIFVDNTGGRAGQPGSYESPTNTIADGMLLGAARYGSDAVVVVEGRPAAYGEDVIITRGVRLFGTGGFPGLGGKEFFQGRTGRMPTINGGFFAKDVPGRVEVSGFAIRGGLNAVGVSTAIDSTGSGIFFESVNEVRVSRNDIEPRSGAIAGVLSETAKGTSRVTVSDNWIRGSNGGVYLSASGSGVVEADVSGNHISRTESTGIRVYLTGNSQGDITLMGNTVVDSSSFGVNAATDGAASGVFTITGNLIADHQMMGLEMIAWGSSRAFFSASSNVVQRNNIGMFIMVAAGPGTAVVHAVLSGNQVTDNGPTQIQARNLGGTLRFFSEDTVSNEVRSGILYDAMTDSQTGSILINGVLHPANRRLP